MHLRFITSTPLDVIRGSGTFTGIATLRKYLRMSGETVDLITPGFRFPIYTLRRILFNEALRFSRETSAMVTVGFDMDGYSVAGRGRFHVASIKGVIADEMRFERGATRATMQVQAHCEKLHVQRADLVIAPSHYSARQIEQLYAIFAKVRVVPEPIDLAQWRQLLEHNPAQADHGKFIVLCVCRFYPRKRMHVLLEAADRLRSKIPELEVRIVGDGPESARLKSICRKHNLDEVVTWLGNVSEEELAAEYNRCHIFCLPSVQEGFGIVFLEAMASAKPVVAARAASAPEVVKHGILVEPDDGESLAHGIERLYLNQSLRDALTANAAEWVKQFDAPIVAAAFKKVVETARADSGYTGKLSAESQLPIEPAPVR